MEIQHMVKPDMDVIRKLSVSERLALVEQIWDSICADPGDVPVSELQMAEARRRLRDHDADPTTGIPWEDAESRLRSKI
jgi:putative addiction module component (TIGR02574 family)